MLGQLAARPRNGVLGSERATLMPSLDDALRRFLAERITEPAFEADRLPGFGPLPRSANAG